MPIVDANLVLRYLLADDAKAAAAARAVIDHQPFELPVEVLCEVVYVLQKVYQVERRKLVLTLREFIRHTDASVPRRAAVLKALAYFSSEKLDFVDCLLAGYAAAEGARIHTFDGRLQKLLDKIAAAR
jgi:predicted nucleic-acid-binding protein